MAATAPLASSAASPAPLASEAAPPSPFASEAAAPSPLASEAARGGCEHVEVLASAEPELAAEAILCMLNRERAARHLSPLRRNPRLTTAADGHSRDMVRRRYFAHTAPGRVTFVRRITRARYARGGAAKLGENLAWGMGDPAAPSAVVSGWMHSPEHRANILDPAFRSIGIGIAAGVPVATASAAAASGATYTTDFGSR
ncbi:CAP domain-containing protein [Conexibacter sp. JD483]|uniref:CAP domain-containing protein n=1 Tax=unclassified Conexibacter TaxID=2627773 RepID=UPI00271E2B8C|nr:MULTISPECIES: CAP domain-containing protein [unclassified Conexibacter]MDO8185501.1 CAP domain-containing protein [Conexibacter sp. CPCC 205706]MDO8197312.1 CAP domain-containing protein [Conexibacter sp. CPCC 205762]MDR9370188.1 CAP domain-containing protein [Conexibacter sp. JD483]